MTAPTSPPRNTAPAPPLAVPDSVRAWARRGDRALSLRGDGSVVLTRFEPGEILIARFESGAAAEAGLLTEIAWVVDRRGWDIHSSSTGPKRRPGPANATKP